MARLRIAGTGILQNSQCSLDAGAARAIDAGASLTLILPVTLKPAFGGAKERVDDGQRSALQQRATTARVVDGAGRNDRQRVCDSSGGRGWMRRYSPHRGVIPPGPGTSLRFPCA